jgi:hypothetical protein
LRGFCQNSIGGGAYFFNGDLPHTVIVLTPPGGARSAGGILLYDNGFLVSQRACFSEIRGTKKGNQGDLEADGHMHGTGVRGYEKRTGSNQGSRLADRCSQMKKNLLLPETPQKLLHQAFFFARGIQVDLGSVSATKISRHVDKRLHGPALKPVIGPQLQSHEKIGGMNPPTGKQIRRPAGSRFREQEGVLVIIRKFPSHLFNHCHSSLNAVGREIPHSIDPFRGIFEVLPAEAIAVLQGFEDPQNILIGMKDENMVIKSVSKPAGQEFSIKTVVAIRNHSVHIGICPEKFLPPGMDQDLNPAFGKILPQSPQGWGSHEYVANGSRRYDQKTLRRFPDF